jgi:hypothetical protein
MAKTSSVTQYSPSQIASSLVAISSLDTLYRDVYLERARGIMRTFLSYDSYNYIKESIASLGLVERQLRAAVQRGDWERTAELTERVKNIKKSAEKGESLELAEEVYDKLGEIPIDPFAPGFYAFYGASAETLKEWRDRALNNLSTLATVDPTAREFYARRRADFENLRVSVQEEKKKESVSSVDLHQEALRAVDSGDLGLLDDLLKKLKEKPEAKDGNGESAEVKLSESADLGEDLLFSFSEDTMAAAGRMGLTPARTESRRQFAYLLPFGWQPSFLEGESKRWAKDQMSRLTHPFETSDRAKEAIELYLFNPFINSGGTRYKVCLVAEDLLVEDFPEPAPKTELPQTELLSELGLKSRWGLTRIDIENALLMHGPRVLKEKLGLDVETFRIVAVPPDIYSILGPKFGWGTQEMWTHFDGYWVHQGGKLQALAGGDARFGGTHDVVSFSPTYTSEKIFARFAVVQRKRMMSWQKS